MKLRCKNGDLALVVHDESSCAANIGKLVRVKGPLNVNARLRLVCWLIEPVKRELWHWVKTKSGKIQVEVVTFASNVEHPDAWLMPLRPSRPSLRVAGRQERRKPNWQSASSVAQKPRDEVVVLEEQL